MVSGKAKPEARTWRLTFELADGEMRVLKLDKRDPKSIDDALAFIRLTLRAAMEAGGCRSVAFGVHVEGAACDHEVGP